MPTADTLRHVLLASVCDYFTCVHVVMFVYFTVLYCKFSINVSFICRLTLNKRVILMQYAKLRMRSKPSKINHKNSVTGNTFCKPVTGLKPSLARIQR